MGVSWPGYGSHAVLAFALDLGLGVLGYVPVELWRSAVLIIMVADRSPAFGAPMPVTA